MGEKINSLKYIQNLCNTTKSMNNKIKETLIKKGKLYSCYKGTSKQGDISCLQNRQGSQWNIREGDEKQTCVCMMIDLHWTLQGNSM